MAFQKKCFGLYLAMSFLAACSSGEGIDAALDAKNGYDVNYHASLSKAFLKMTQDQQETYNWVVSDLSQEYFIAYYGKTPTVKTVIDGQLNRFAENNGKQIADQKAFIAKNADEIEVSEAQRKRSVEIIRSIKVDAHYVVGKPNKKLCQGLGCDDERKEVPMIEYHVSDPRNLNLGKLPCYAQIEAPGLEKPLTVDFRGCNEPGTFREVVEVPKGVSLEGTKINVFFVTNDARMHDYSRAVPNRHPALVRMMELESTRDLIAKTKKSMATSS